MSTRKGFFILCCLFASTSAFRFYGGSEGANNGDLFGSADFNAVPRLGKRLPGLLKRGLDSNRFRFRFNGGDEGHQQLRKRMAEAMAEDQQASNLQSTGEDPDVEDVEAYSFADEYWKEYLNDVARKKVMQSLIRPLVSGGRLIPPAVSAMAARKQQGSSLGDILSQSF